MDGSRYRATNVKKPPESSPPPVSGRCSPVVEVFVSRPESPDRVGVQAVARMFVVQVLPSTSVGENECGSCSKLTGRKTSCRTLKHSGVSYDAVPLDLLRK